MKTIHYTSDNYTSKKTATHLKMLCIVFVLILNTTGFFAQNNSATLLKPILKTTAHGKGVQAPLVLKSSKYTVLLVKNFPAIKSEDSTLTVMLESKMEEYDLESLALPEDKEHTLANSTELVNVQKTETKLILQ